MTELRHITREMIDQYFEIPDFEGRWRYLAGISLDHVREIAGLIWFGRGEFETFDEACKNFHTSHGVTPALQYVAGKGGTPVLKGLLRLQVAPVFGLYHDERLLFDEDGRLYAFATLEQAEQAAAALPVCPNAHELRAARGRIITAGDREEC